MRPGAEVTSGPVGSASPALACLQLGAGNKGIGRLGLGHPGKRGQRGGGPGLEGTNEQNRLVSAPDAGSPIRGSLRRGEHRTPTRARGRARAQVPPGAGASDPRRALRRGGGAGLSGAPRCLGLALLRAPPPSCEGAASRPLCLPEGARLASSLVARVPSGLADPCAWLPAPPHPGVCPTSCTVAPGQRPGGCRSAGCWAQTCHPQSRCGPEPSRPRRGSPLQSQRRRARRTLGQAWTAGGQAVRPSGFRAASLRGLAGEPAFLVARHLFSGRNW